MLCAHKRLVLGWLRDHRGARAGLREGDPAKKEATTAMSGGVEAISDFLKSSTGRTITREVVRGVFGLLKKKR